MRLPSLPPLLLLLLLALLPPSAANLFPSDAFQQSVHHWLHWGADSHPPSAADPARHPRAVATARPAPRRLPAWVLGAASANATRVDYQRQMMHRTELDLIAAYLRPTDIYLEWGAGGSTLNFAKAVGKLYSIEHDCEWARFVAEQIPNAVDLRCIEVHRGHNGWGTWSSFEHGNYRQFANYVDEVANLGHKRFDKVLIDGRARVACALKLLPYLNDDSVVFIHDFYARVPHYSPVLEYYEEVARVLAYRNHNPRAGPIDEPQGLLVLRRRKGVRYPLTPAQIHQAYAGGRWREPFGAPIRGLSGHVRYYVGLAGDWGRWKRARNPDDLVEFVRHDILRLALVYGIVMFAIRNWKAFVDARAAERAGGSRAATGESAGRSMDRGVEAVGGQARAREDAAQRAVEKRKKNEPRFVETEAMKTAQARRKMRAKTRAPV